jgi:dTDP-glucose pyrophosphorylase
MDTLDIQHLKPDKNIVKHNCSMLDAIKILNKATIKILLVVDNAKVLIGTITDGDIRRSLINNENLNPKCLDIMNNKPMYVFANDSKKISKLIHDHSFSIPIVDENKKILKLCALLKPIKRFNNTVVIMAGGRGERLLPLTKNTPKPMLLINKKPIIYEIVKNIKSHGFTNILISVNYLRKQLIDYFGNGEELGVNIDYLSEKKPLGTAGALSLINSDSKEPIIVLNGDVVSNLNFMKLLDFHKKSKMQITMCAANHSISIPYGVIEIKGSKIIKLKEKPIKNYLVNAGIYVISRAVLKKIDKNKKIDMTELIDQYLKINKVAAYPIYEDWADIGTLKDYEKITSNN